MLRLDPTDHAPEPENVTALSRLFDKGRHGKWFESRLAIAIQPPTLKQIPFMGLEKLTKGTLQICVVF